MEENYNESENSDAKELVKHVEMQWPVHITVLDLSHQNLDDFAENVKFPPKLNDLNFSHNKLSNLPSALLNLSFIKNLDLSFNSIQWFDDTPNFCHNIQYLNLSNNCLKGPPYWVWTENPTKLTKLDISCNINMTQSFENGYLEELLQYKTLVKEIIIYNCRLRDCLKFLSTFSKAKSLELGKADYSVLLSNEIQHVPCTGLNQCCDVERLNLSNTHIYEIDPSIDIYKNLVDLNLSYNNISSIPNRLCNLENLETCILSGNVILYLPEDMVKLKKLQCLLVDSNKLCMLPDDICHLPQLKILDLFDNDLYEVPNEVWNIEELDLAQNYLEEPVNEEYLAAKEKLRLNGKDRINGRKIEIERPESEYSNTETDDEELIEYLNNLPQNNDTQNQEIHSDASTEDWDSEDYWEPHAFQGKGMSTESAWIHFVAMKMQEGNFCPVDLHTVSVTEKVKYDKMNNPRPWTFVEGQFDDCSDDES